MKIGRSWREWLGYVSCGILSLAFLQFCPVETPSNFEWRITLPLNRVTARCFAEFFNGTAVGLPLHSVSVDGKATVHYLRYTPKAGFEERTLSFYGDNFFHIAWRIWILYALMLLACPPRTLNSKEKLLMVVSSGCWIFGYMFLFRCFAMGALASLLDLARHYKPVHQTLCALFPLTVWYVSTISFGLGHLIKRKWSTHSVSGTKTNAVVLIALLILIEGCKGALSHNSISVSVGGESGSLPYMTVLAFIAGSFFSNLRQRKREERKRAKELGTGNGEQGIKTGEKPKTAEEAIRRLAEKDAREEIAKLERIKYLLTANWFYAIGDDGAADDKPDGFEFFETLRTTLEHEIKKIESGKITAPISCAEWQRILPEALTFPTDEAHYYEATDKDDPSTIDYELADRTKVRIGWMYRPHPLSTCIDKVKDLTLRYLTDALRFAESVNSPSKDKWAEALGCYNRVTHAFRMPQSRPLLEQMAQAMIEAATRLEIDIKYSNPKAAPVAAYITDISKEGGKALREAFKDRGGPTVKPDGAPRKLTQKEIAASFGPPCNEDMVANWERYAKTSGKQGATPPSATYKGKPYSYSQELRTNPTPENMEILTEIIKDFKRTSGVKDGIDKFVHPKSEESLYRQR